MHSVMGGGGARLHSRRARAAAAVPFTVLVLVALDCCGSGGAAAARVAVIGDYGFGDAGEQAVVQLIKAWDASTPLTAVATLGNNNMPGGLQRNIAARVGGFYGWAMAPAPNNRFWPSPGSHDWGNQCGDDTRLKPYLDYFAAIGVTQSVYDVRVTSDIHLFMLDSDCNEPMGRNSTSQQADWLKGALAASDAPLKLVLLHHAPFSSSLYGSDPEMQWPFEEWGADAVLAAHDHTYERLLNPRGLAGRDGFPYFVNGLGGAPRFPFKSILPSSKARYNGKNGAMLLTSRAVTSGDVIRYELDLAFYAAGGAAGGGGPGAGATAAAPRDCYRIIKTMGASLGGVTTTYAAGCPSAGDEFSLLTNRLAFLSAPSPGQAWSYYVGGKLPPTSKSGATWVSVGFDDSAWPSGPAPLGYGADPPGGSGWATALATNTAASGARYYYLRALVCLSIEAAAQLSSLPVGVRVASGGPSKVYLNKNLVASDAAPDRRFVYWNAAAQVKKGLLVAGPNVIAAQVSDSAGAPGGGFDLDLVYSAAAAVGSGGTGCGHHSLLAARDAAGAPAARPWRFYSAGAAALTSSSSKGKPSWLSATFDDSVWAVVTPPVALGAAAAANAAAAPSAQGAPQQADTAVSGQEKTAGPVAAAANHAAGQRPAAAAASKPAAGGTKNYYFRMKFCLSTDVAFKLSLSAPKLTVSAGARVYINGALAASDPSGGKAGGGSGRITKDLKKRALVAGLNVIAVQVLDMGSPAVAGFDIDLSYLWNEPLVASFLPESCQ